MTNRRIFKGRLRRAASLLLSSALLVTAAVIPALAEDRSVVEINENNFPDYELRQYYVTPYDTNKNGWLEESEIAAVDSIRTGERVADLTGIEYFTEITWLRCNYGSKLKSVDISKNTKLREIQIWGTGITSIDLSHNTELEEFTLKGRGDVTSDVGLSEIDFSHNPKLTSVNLDNNFIKTLDFSHNPELEFLGASNNGLESVNISACTKLQKVYLDHNSLTSLDLSNKPNLDDVLIGKNEKLRDLKIAGNVTVSRLDVANSGLTSLDVSGCRLLSVLYCYESKDLSELKLDGCGLLELLQCYDCSIESLNLASCANLSYLSCGKNKLAVLDVSHCPKLEDLKCEDNRIESLDVSSCSKLSYLDCQNNELASLDLSNNGEIKYGYGTTYESRRVKTDGNLRTVELADGKLDLSTIDGFDVSRASEWSGGTVVNGILTFADGSSEVTYRYKTREGLLEPFGFRIKTDAPAEKIETAAIEEATLSFKAGDQPSFTGKVPAADADKYEIVYERWERIDPNDPNTVLADLRSDGESSGIPALTEFEDGGVYSYSVMLRAKDGYTFTAREGDAARADVVLTVNGKEADARNVTFVMGNVYGARIAGMTPAGDAVSGDLDGDGRITVNDAIGVLKIVAGWDVKDKFNCDVADVDCDGKIAIGDAILILKYVAGWKDIVLGRK